MKSVEWKTYRTRFLVKAKQLSSSLSFVDHLGRQHCGRKGDYLVESSDGVISIAPRQIFEDIYVPMSLLGEPDPTEARTGETPICANTIGERTIGERTIGEKTASRSIASEPKFKPLRFEALEIEQLKLGRRPATRRRVNDVPMPRQDVLQQDLAHQDGVRQDVVREPESAPVRRKLPQPCRDRRAPVSQSGLM